MITCYAQHIFPHKVYIMSLVSFVQIQAEYLAASKASTEYSL